MSSAATDLLCINTIRTLSIDAVQKANSGHPGLPLGAAPMAWVLWSRHLRHNPKDPAWPNRDRFVLSAGHGSMLLYSLLHLTGYDVSLDELLAFRQWGSKTPGHPETFMTPGVEATTGPLGQGSANAVGMALAERYLAHRYNKPGHTVVDYFTYALVSDGDLMEGVNAEAASLAGHLGLGKLIYLYDANDVTLDGPADMHFTEDTCKRYEAYGWQVLRVEDGNADLDAIDNAIRAAQNEPARPSLIWIHTTIGFGSPNKGGTAEAHGSPLGPDEIKLTKQALGWEADKSFLIPEAALAEFRSAVGRGAEQQADWNRARAAWATAHPELGREWDVRVGAGLPEGWDADLPAFPPGKAVATRSASGKALQVIAKQVPWLLGGDADLGGSTKTLLDGAGSFDGRTGAGRNIHFGVREHAMGSICNGMAYGGGMRPYAATFFVFSDYMRPAVRLAAMNHLPVIYVWTHDSIGLGEDGPTHQPVEHLASLRAMPGLVVLRPADANETVEAWRVAMKRGDGPTALVLSRQDLPVLDRAAGFGPAADVARGAYVLREPAGGAPQAILIGTGAEVHVALAAAEALAGDGVRARVVSMPSWELYAAQPQSYRDQVLPPALTARVSVEAGASFGWERWLGSGGAAVAVDKFGASAPAKVLFEKYGFTPANVAGVVKRLLGR